MNPEHIAKQMGEVTTDVKWMREWMEKADRRFAPYWIKYPVYIMLSALTIDAISNLIPKVQALL